MSVCACVCIYMCAHVMFACMHLHSYVCMCAFVHIFECNTDEMKYMKFSHACRSASGKGYHS